MITLKLPYNCVDKDFNLNNLRRQFSSIVRWSYNRFKEDIKEIDVRHLSKNLNNIDLLDSWLMQCAILEGKSIYIRNKDEKVIFGGKHNFYSFLKRKITLKRKILTLVQIFIGS